MKVLYTITIYLLSFTMHCLALLSPKIKKGVQGRKQWRKDIEGLNTNQKTIWMHCASLGEYEMGAPLLKKLKAEYPEYQYVITFFSPSGYDIIQPKSEDIVCYLPFDTRKELNPFLDQLKPDLVIHVKYEYWYNLIQLLFQKDIPQIVISALFSEDKLFFKPYGKWFLDQLRKLNYFFVQNEKSQNILQAHNITQVQISGDTRFDRVKQNKENAKTLHWLEEFKSHHKLLIGGSIWEADFGLFKRFLSQNQESEIKVLLAPHEIDSTTIQHIEEQLTEVIHTDKIARYSVLNHKDPKELKVIILDTIGLLKYSYRYADIAYVGGGFKKAGLHNILEPAVFGNALVAGPNLHSFPEAQELKTKGALYSVQNAEEFTQIIQSLLSNDELLNEKKAQAQNFVYSKPHSVQIIYNEVVRQNWLSSP